MKYEYGYDIWTDMLPYGEDYHQDAICQSLEKKYTKHRKAINFFLPSSKGREREKKWGQTGN